MNLDSTPAPAASNAAAIRAIDQVFVRLAAAHQLAARSIDEPENSTDLLESLKAIIEGVARKLDQCAKTLGGPGTGTLD